MLPEKYKWLVSEGAPKMLVEALKLFGTRETLGSADTPVIMAWSKELGLKDYTHDSIAWCGLFMAIIAKKAGKEVVNAPLWAANWLHFGTPVTTAMLGDVMVFARPGGHHVALYVGEDKFCYHILGGNQSDAVTITRILKTRLKGIRRPVYSIGQPANVRRIFLSADGAVSQDEA